MAVVASSSFLTLSCMVLLAPRSGEARAWSCACVEARLAEALGPAAAGVGESDGVQRPGSAGAMAAGGVAVAMRVVAAAIVG
eukprot:5885055-Pleurochrysis_carterae.AAC.1